MESAGMMEQVRGLLAQGLRSSEIIAQGYAASTVYGVQRKLRKQQGLLGNGFLPGPNGQGYQSGMASENRWLLSLGLMSAATLNLISRKMLALFFERALFLTSVSCRHSSAPPGFRCSGSLLRRGISRT